MNCPLCTNTGLNQAALEKELPASTCPGCGGTWISAVEYWKWHEKPRRQSEQPASSTLLSVSDSKAAKLCPECGKLLTQYKVGQGLGFAIERCARCQGLWLDKNEWETLKVNNLHDELHLVFDPKWQRQIQAEEHERKMQPFYEEAARHTQLMQEEHRRQKERAYEDKFGPATYQEIKRIREWLSQQPEHPALLAFLNASDPYKL